MYLQVINSWNMWLNTGIWERPLQIKIACMYKLRADWNWGMSAIFSPELGDVCYLQSRIGGCLLPSVQNWGMSAIFSPELGDVCYFQSRIGGCLLHSVQNWGMSATFSPESFVFLFLLSGNIKIKTLQKHNFASQFGVDVEELGDEDNV
jgi:hypothetical protein